MKLRAAKAWSKWEASTSFINHNPEAVKHSVNSEFPGICPDRKSLFCKSGIS